MEVSLYSFQKSKMSLLGRDFSPSFPIFYPFMREKSPLLLLVKLEHETELNNSITILKESTNICIIFSKKRHV